MPFSKNVLEPDTLNPSGWRLAVEGAVGNVQFEPPTMIALGKAFQSALLDLRCDIGLHLKFTRHKDFGENQN
jgi:hypothetical protein